MSQTSPPPAQTPTPNVTAAVTAYARAYHTTNAQPAIFADPLAGALLTADQHEMIGHGLASLLSLYDPAAAAGQPDTATALALVVRQFAPITLSRGRYTEDALRAAFHAGARQYVILGAGLDSFAHRRPAELDALRVFEVDHPATQRPKLDRIASLGWQIPAGVHHLPIDFATGSLTEVLASSPYDPGTLGFFSWLGVTYYLAADVVRDTLRAIAAIAPPGTAVVFDYLDVAAHDPERVTRRAQVMRHVTDQTGELIRTAFDPLTLEKFLAEAGFELAEHLSPAEIQRAYFDGRSDGYQADELIWFAKAVVASR